jgi:hypothetical protein
MKKTTIASKMRTIGTLCRRLSAITLAFALVFTFAACSNGTTGGGGGKKDPPKDPTPTPPKVSDFYGTWKEIGGMGRKISSDEIIYLDILDGGGDFFNSEYRYRYAENKRSVRN